MARTTDNQLLIRVQQRWRLYEFSGNISWKLNSPLTEQPPWRTNRERTSMRDQHFPEYKLAIWKRWVNNTLPLGRSGRSIVTAKKRWVSTGNFPATVNISHQIKHANMHSVHWLCRYTTTFLPATLPASLPAPNLQQLIGAHTRIAHRVVTQLDQLKCEIWKSS